MREKKLEILGNHKPYHIVWVIIFQKFRFLIIQLMRDVTNVFIFSKDTTNFQFA